MQPMALSALIVMDHQYGLNQGFDTYDDVFEAAELSPLYMTERKGDETTAHAIQWLQGACP